MESIESLIKQHHIWCNYFMTDPKTCRMCKGLFENYPMDENTTIEEMMEKHFPDVIRLN